MTHKKPARYWVLGCVAWLGLMPVQADVAEYTTPAGHRFTFVPMPEAKRTSINIDWAADWILDTDAPAASTIGVGLMQNGGAGGRDAATLQADFEKLNAQGGLFALSDGVRGAISATPAQLLDVASITRDVLVAPHMEQRWFERIRTDLAERQAQVADEPSSILLLKALNYLLSDARLSRSVALKPDTVAATTLDDVNTWRNAVFAQSNTTLAAAGNASPKQVGTAIDVMLDGLPESPPKLSVDQPTARIDGKTILIVDESVTRATVGMLGPLPPTRDGDDHLDLLALTILGAGEQSRLFKALRTDLQSGFDFGAGTQNYRRDIRMLMMAGEIDTAKLPEALEVIRRTYESYRANGPKEQETKTVAAQVANSMDEAFQEPDSVANSLIEIRLDDQPASLIDELVPRIRTTTASELQARIANVFPAYDDILRVVIAPSADAIEADCVIEATQAVARCH